MHLLALVLAYEPPNSFMQPMLIIAVIVGLILGIFRK